MKQGIPGECMLVPHTPNTPTHSITQIMPPLYRLAPWNDAGGNASGGDRPSHAQKTFPPTPWRPAADTLIPSVVVFWLPGNGSCRTNVRGRERSDRSKCPITVADRNRVQDATIYHTEPHLPYPQHVARITWITPLPCRRCCE